MSDIRSPSPLTATWLIELFREEIAGTRKQLPPFLSFSFFFLSAPYLVIDGSMAAANLPFLNNLCCLLLWTSSL